MLGPDPVVASDAPVLRVGTLSKTLGALGGFVAGPRAAHRPRREPGPLLHLHHRARPRPTPPPRLAAVEIVRSQEGDDLRARLRANVDQLREGHPSPIVPVPCGDEARALDARGRAARPRPARPGDPSADGAARHLAPARRALGRAHARPGPHAARRARRARPRVTTTVFVTGTGTDVGKTWVLVRARSTRCAPTDARVDGPQARAVLRARRSSARPTRSCSRRATGDAADDGLSRAPLVRDPDGTTDGRRRARSRRVHDRRPRRRDPGAGTGRRLAFVEGAGGPRSPLAADGDNVDLARAVGAQLAVLVADAGLGTINAVRLVRRRARRLRHPRRASTGSTPHDDLHGRNRAWLADAGYQVLTSIDGAGRRGREHDFRSSRASLPLNPR